MSASDSASATASNRRALPRVAFQGALGAFSELAIRQHWPAGANPLPQLTFAAAIDCALSRQADFAAIPVENVIAGPVHAALEALGARCDSFVQCGELKLNVRMCLMAPAGSRVEHLQNVLSHPMALAQCKGFFSRHAWLVPVVHGDTASAAHDIATQQLPHAAAIASEAAAARYGLEILEADIQDIRDNWTRFVLLRAR